MRELSSELLVPPGAERRGERPSSADGNRARGARLIDGPLERQVRKLAGTDLVEWSQNRPGTGVTVCYGWRLRRCAMPWQKTTPRTARLSLIALDHTRLWRLPERCTRFHISRNTGYKWLRRYLHKGCSGLAGEASRTPRRSAPPRCRRCRRAVGGHAAASVLGPAEDPALGSAALPGSRVAGREQCGRTLPPRGTVAVPAAAAPAAASGRPDAPRRCAERGGDGRWHRALPHRRRGVGLSAHRGGRLLARSAGLHRPTLHAAGGGPARLRAAVPRVWPACGESHR